MLYLSSRRTPLVQLFVTPLCHIFFCLVCEIVVCTKVLLFLCQFFLFVTPFTDNVLMNRIQGTGAAFHFVSPLNSSYVHCLLDLESSHCLIQLTSLIIEVLSSNFVATVLGVQFDMSGEVLMPRFAVYGISITIPSSISCLYDV